MIESHGNIMSVNRPAATATLAEYATALADRGTRLRQTQDGTFWIGYETGALMRLPKFQTEPPSPCAIRELFWHSGAALISYLLEPDDLHPANAWLYLCADRSYCLAKLAPAVRRNVRRGLRELTIEPITTEQLLFHGVHAFCDTRRRVGLNDGTPEEFHRQFASRGGSPGHVFLGAWKNDQLAAFLSITEVEDWAETGCFSTDALLNLRPNDALFFYALSHYLTERGFRLVSYGLSSVQAESNVLGLHVFKTKLGFEAHPVHRAFVLHPFFRPLANRLTLWGVNGALRLIPRDRHLKKMRGVLASILNKALPESYNGSVDE
jgi:hypothetical protein